jgi:hypothetical protein
VSIRRHSEHYYADPVGVQLDWMSLYQKMATLVTEEHLRSLCRRGFRQRALALAGVWAERGDRAQLARSLAFASVHAWPYPTWWWGVAKALAKSVVHEPLRAVLRRKLRIATEMAPTAFRARRRVDLRRRTDFSARETRAGR